MTTLLLIRHAVNDYVKTGKLAGRTPGVHLNEEGQAQAAALGARLAHKPLRAIYASPLERTLETAQAIAAHYPDLRIQPLDAMSEVDFGAWQGGEINKLVHLKMWPVIQTVPSRAYFPGGESVRQAQGRAVDALERLVQVHPRQMVAVVSHSDIIKLMLAYYLGMPIDLFQRIVIAPASISVVELDHARPMVVQINDTSHIPPRVDEPADGQRPN